MKEVAINMVSSMKDTMSSLEIAKLTGKEHFHVMRDIEKFLLDIGCESNFGCTYLDAQGKSRPCFNLPKRECLGLASGYDAKLRMLIIDRWAELEYNQHKLPQTFAQALMLAGKLEEEKQQALLLIESQRKELEVAYPVLSFHEELKSNDQHFTLSAVCKIICDNNGYDIGKSRLVDMLRSDGLIMKKSYEPTQKAVNENILAVKSEWINKKLKLETVITMKGTEYIMSKLQNKSGDFSLF